MVLEAMPVIKSSSFPSAAWGQGYISQVPLCETETCPKNVMGCVSIAGLSLEAACVISTYSFVLTCQLEAEDLTECYEATVVEGC